MESNGRSRVAHNQGPARMRTLTALSIITMAIAVGSATAEIPSPLPMRP